MNLLNEVLKLILHEMVGEKLKHPPFIRAEIQHDMVGKMLKRVTIDVFLITK